MIKRKVITFVIATILTITFVLAFIYGEWRNPYEFFPMIGIYSLFFSPFFLLYGAPVTFFSDYITKRFTGVKRVVSAFIIHLVFGMSFTFIFVFFTTTRNLFRDFDNYWGKGMDEFFIAATVASFLFWAIDEILRHFIPGTTFNKQAFREFWRNQMR